MTVTQQEAARFCRQKLARLIGQARFELWFSSDQSISIVDNKLVVSADNEFSLDVIRKKFHSELRQLAKHELGNDGYVEFVVSQSKPELASVLDFQKDSSSLDLDSPENPQKEQSQKISSQNGAKNQSKQKGFSDTTQFADETCYNPTLANQDVADSVVAELPVRNEPQRTITAAQAFQSADQRLTQSATSTLDTNRKSQRRWESLNTFVVDSRNKIAATSAAQIVQNIGEITPLFISGPTGSGKTHLLEGTFRAARSRVRSGRVLYMSSDQYTNQFLGALHQRSMPIFRQRFQELDVFLLDDIQFFHNKRATVVELVQMIDNMVRHGKQLILSADRTLAELDFLGAELITRISSGLVCRVDYPEIEARKQIITQLATERNLQLDPPVVELVAERIIGDLRNIRGAINRLQAYHFATGDPITFENARQWLQDIFQAASKNPSLKEIEDEVCKLFGLEQATLRSDKKVRSISQPRMLAMWLSRKYTRAALSEIGDFFGGRSHSTVVSARNKVTTWVKDGQRMQTLSGEVTVQDAIRRIETRLHVG